MWQLDILDNAPIIFDFYNYDIIAYHRAFPIRCQIIS